MINLVLICSSVLSAGISLSLLSPFYPKEALTKGVSVTQSGLVLGSVFISTVIFTPIFGKYLQVIGARRSLVFGFIFVALGNISFGFLKQVENKVAFLVLSVLIRIFVAIGDSAIAPSSYALAENQVSQEKRGMAIAVVEACWGIGNVFGPSLGGLLYDLGGFPLPFWVLGSLMLLIAIFSLFYLKDETSSKEKVVVDIEVSWREILSVYDVLISFFALTFAACAWTWHTASLEQFLWTSYSMTSAQTGLVFMLFGLCYTVFTPVCGFLMDTGLDGFVAMAVGNSVILIALLFIGPIPLLQSLSGNSWLTVVAMGVQGAGSAGTYLGTLLHMLKSARDAGLPDNDQVKGMVSSLWVVAICVGGYLGSSLGGVAYDTVGFEDGTFAMSIAMAVSVILLFMFRIIHKFNGTPEKSGQQHKMQL